ncbi:unnamed protein product [Lupinus luteus]|uniref:Uncharacterized protein n=1 Tax=Lupinus luteus TaxID=3873 RepID=A0AAV1W728_LUPLU
MLFAHLQSTVKRKRNKVSLEQKVQLAERMYEEFEPPFDWAHDESSDTLILMLPGSGFK